jgi:hypothetical protein
MEEKRKTSSNQLAGSENDIIINFRKHRLVIQNRYEVVHILNDILISIWFFTGSIFFLFPNLKDMAIGLFIVGSGHMLVRPTIRIIHKIHIKRISNHDYDGNRLRY